MSDPRDTPPAGGDDFGDFAAGIASALGATFGTMEEAPPPPTPPPPPPRVASPPAPRGPVSRTHPLRIRLDDLLTRCFYSGAGYVFESDPYVVPEDDDLLKALAAIREEDRRHAFVLGALVQSLGGVPSPGVFPWWNLDLNFLTVPCVSRFVVETLEDEVGLYEALVRDWFEGDAGGRAALASILDDKRRHVATLRPVVDAALARELAEQKTKIAKVKSVRAARLAKAKAAADAAKKAKAAAGRPAVPGAAKPAAAAAPTAALLDPKEPGISSHERGRRTVLKMRAERGIAAPTIPGAAAPAATPVAAPATGGAVDVASLPDPNEPGISPKEKGRRAIARQRAAAGAAAAPSAAAAPAAAPAAPAADLLDPNEPGISPKERGRRQVAKNRAAAGGGAAAAAASAPAGAVPAAVAAPAPTAAAPAAPPAEELLDPDEPGISSKEKGRRKVLWMRAHKS